MATRADQLLKAREAMKARASGTTDAFVEKSRMDKEKHQAQQVNVSAMPSAPPPAPNATTATTATPQPVAVVAPPAAFVGLRRPSVVDDLDEVPLYDDSVDGSASTRSPARPAFGPSGEVTSAAPQTSAPASAALPVPTSLNRSFAGLAKPRGASQPPPPPPPTPAQSTQAGTDAINKAVASPVSPAAPREPDPPWPDRTLPAGTRFTADEWAAARMGEQFHVLEVRSGAEGALVQVPAAPTTVLATGKTVVGGKVSTPARTELALSTEFIDPFMGQVLDGCLLLGPKAPTTHPRSATSHVTVQMPDGASWPYRIVRPEAQRNDPFLAALFQMKGSLPLRRPDYEKPGPATESVEATQPPKQASHRTADAPLAVVALAISAQAQSTTAAAAPREEQGDMLFPGEEDEANFASQAAEAERERVTG